MATTLGARNFRDPDGVDLKVRDLGGTNQHAQAVFEDWASALTRSAVAAVTSPTAAATLASAGVSTLRRAMSIYNNSSAALYVKLGASASTNDFDFIVGAGEYWEMPRPVWTGVVTGTWASANGDARVLEYL